MSKQPKSKALQAIQDGQMLGKILRSVDAATVQVMPRGQGVAVVCLVKADLDRRAEVGEKKYGERLKPFNGRDALMDAYQEALDLCMYLRQLIAGEESKMNIEDYRRYKRVWMRKKRQRLRERGLTETGRPRVNRVYRELHGLRGHKRELARRAIIRADFLAKGLLCNGKPRTHRYWPELKHLSPQQRRLNYYRLRSAENIAKGLCWDGKPRLDRRTALRRAWDELRATMDIAPVPELSMAREQRMAA